MDEMRLWLVWDESQALDVLVVDTEENVAQYSEEYTLVVGQPRCYCGHLADGNGVDLCAQHYTERMEEDYRAEWDVPPLNDWLEEELRNA